MHLDIPDRDDLAALAARRADACVSLYLPATPITGDAQADRIAFRNLCDAAEAQLEASGFDKRRLRPLREGLDDLRDDDGFWARQGRGLAVLATADDLRTFRLPYAPDAAVQVSDRFHLRPLVPVLSPATAVVVQVAQQGVRVIEIGPDSAEELEVRDLPKDFSDALGRTQQRDRAPRGRVQGDEGANLRIRQFCRALDDALRPALRGRRDPLILAGTRRLVETYRSVNSYPRLSEESLDGNTEHLSDDALAEEARRLLVAHEAAAVARWRERFSAMEGESRSAADLAVVARAAAGGQVASLMVAAKAGAETMPGLVDETTGEVLRADAVEGGAASGDATAFPEDADVTDGVAPHESAATYDVVDEVVSLVLATGGEVVGVRAEHVPGGGPVAAILRYPLIGRDRSDEERPSRAAA